VVALLGIGLWASWPAPLGLVLDRLGLLAPPSHPALPDKPSIVVLPFVNMSGDPEQEYFSDGITDDLITDLSSLPELFLIASNSAFTYKGKRANVEEVARQLGVRYVLEGSVRRAGGRIRISAQLIDATTGFHLWSERYDRALDDVLALQSELSGEIVAALPVTIREAEMSRIQSKPTASLSAYEAFMRGYSLFIRFRRDDLGAARRYFERAIELDPGYAKAHALLGSTYTLEYLMGWNVDPALLDRAEALSLRALELDPLLANSHITRSVVASARGRSAEALAAAQRAVEADPNLDVARAFLASALLREGRIGEALEEMQQMVRLNPQPGPAGWALTGMLNFGAGRIPEAVDLWERARRANPDLITARVPLAAYYAASGRHEEARAVVGEILRVNPDFTADLAERLSSSGPMRMNVDPESLRRAGLP
jgi:adenylate cyclase